MEGLTLWVCLAAVLVLGIALGFFAACAVFRGAAADAQAEDARRRTVEEMARESQR